ncbi:MAG: bifunctional 4-hydroxy-2-oxoglutarate aldolase/2-dehydro-3-deoxy-phosphogluconate aldolase [Clostridiales bacterium]|nr:bifunctional 4-hydroxy-2-oxoglutarate aldolase/2-dehydro-3-deoxy-phosphogluconate aldolase [Clostridiales bacterium]
MDKYGFFEALKKQKIAAVLRGDGAEVLTAAERLVRGGVKILEITFTVFGAAELIGEIRAKYGGGGVIVGAGTVLDAETARTAILAGAEFIVSPVAAAEVVRLCNRYSVAVIPGVATATELLSVLENGADFVKLFPADINILRALKAPFPNARFMVTGGVGLENLAEFFRAGAEAVGAGSNLTGKNADIKKWIDLVHSIEK